MEFVKVTQKNIYLLKDFINNLGAASESFRYFNSRPLQVINNHLTTLLIVEENKPVAYGHLDREKNTVWLGICVLPSFSRKGYGQEMMRVLIGEAKELNLNSISLSVDKENKLAIRLYEKFNFKKLNKYEEAYQYILLLNSSF